jgi:hypothetical protein
MTEWFFTAALLLQLCSNVGLLFADGALDKRLKHIEDALWFIEKEHRGGEQMTDYDSMSVEDLILELVNDVVAMGATKRMKSAHLPTIESALRKAGDKHRT